jgi:uncharacterized membrane protein YiaA
LAVTITLAGGWGRASLVAGTTALVSGLLLAAISMLRLYEAPQWPLDERVLGAVRDPGTRPGAILGVLLLALPLVLLLDQAVRLGTTARRQRFAALAVAGATRSDLRRWGAVEVGLPALVGGVLGIPVWWLLRQVSGPQGTSLVPTSVGPGAWALLAVLMTGAYGAAVGFRMGSRVGKDPTHQTDRPPRPWAALLLIVAAVLLAVGNDVVDSDLLSLGLVSLLVLAIAGLAPWTAFVVASLVASRTARPALLLAGRRLQLDPRPAGRAAAAVGAVGLTAGVLSVFVPDVLATQSSDRGYYLGPALVAGFGALAALLVIALSLGVHLTESVLERHRELAALVASGVPAEVVSRSQRLECLLATVPLAIVGAAVGGLGYSYLDSMAAATYVLSAVFITGAASAGACWLVTALLRPWLLDALQPEHLRTA